MPAFGYTCVKHWQPNDSIVANDMVLVSIEKLYRNSQVRGTPAALSVGL
jgi:hypothetical protein